MRNVREMVTTQVRVYPVGVFPFSTFRSRAWIEGLQKRYSFSEAGVLETGEIGGSNGEFVDPKSGDRYAVHRVQIADRRTVVSLGAPSSVVDRFHSTLLEAMRIEGTLADLLVPAVFRQEVACTVNFDFDPFEMLSQPVRSFIESLPARLEDEEATAVLGKMLCRFELRYMPKSDELLRQGISLSNKPLVVEPLADSLFEDRCYFTQSPLDSDGHLQLLADFEKAIVAARPNGQSAPAEGS